MVSMLALSMALGGEMGRSVDRAALQRDRGENGGPIDGVIWERPSSASPEAR